MIDVLGADNWVAEALPQLLWAATPRAKLFVRFGDSYSVWPGSRVRLPAHRVPGKRVRRWTPPEAQTTKYPSQETKHGDVPDTLAQTLTECGEIAPHTLGIGVWFKEPAASIRVW